MVNQAAVFSLTFFPNADEDAEAMRELLKDAEHGDQDSVPEA